LDEAGVVKPLKNLIFSFPTSVAVRRPPPQTLFIQNKVK